MTTLKGNGFILRPFKHGDEESQRRHINDKAIARATMTIPHPYKEKDAKWWVNHCLENYKKRPLTDFVFAVDIGGEVVGAVGLHHIEPKLKVEIGYWLGREYWGKGIMTEAVKLATNYAFEKMHLRRVYAYVFPWNKGSAHVLEKAGYSLEGLSRKSTVKNGKCLDELVFAKTK